MKNDNQIKSFLISSGIISALIGAFISVVASWYFLNHQIDNANEQEIYKTRTSLIREVEALFGKTAFVQITIQQGTEAAQKLNKVKLCTDARDCDLSNQQAISYAAIKEVSEITAQYKSLIRIVPISFCQKTAEIFSRVKSEDKWWLDQYKPTREEMLNVMYNERECQR